MRMVFIPFVTRGLYKNRRQITCGLWAIVCQPLIKIVDQKFLMLFQSIQENQNDPGAFILAIHFQVGLFKILGNYKFELYKLYELNKGCCWLWFALHGWPSCLSETLRGKDARSMTASGLEAMRTIT